MSASSSAKTRMERIMRLQDEIDGIKSDIRDIYAEEKAEGGDKTAMGLAITKIRKRAKDKTSFDEREILTDVYLSAFDAPSIRASHTYARVKGGEQPVTADTASTGSDAVRPSLAARGEEESAATLSRFEAMDALTAASAEELNLSDQPQAGGDHVEREPSAATHQAGSGLVSTPRPAAIPGAVTFEVDPPVPMKRASFAHYFPELTKSQYEALEADIIASPCGVEEPIVRKGDVILDGFCRFNIARSIGEEYPVIEYDGSDELLDVIRWQRSSRDWTPAQEAKIAKALAAEVPARAEEIFAAFHIVPMREEEVA
jgi:uncharacterized protein (UPF0335 family)